MMARKREQKGTIPHHPTKSSLTSTKYGEKIQKVLSSAGVGSRRDIEDWIRLGRIQVDGERATIGIRVLPTAEIFLDGQLVPVHRDRCRVLAYNKPVGEIVSRKSAKGMPTVFDHLPLLDIGRWVNVGRLDVATEGLILFSNDGNLANTLAHPRYGFQREYVACVDRSLSESECRVVLSGELLLGRKNLLVDRFEAMHSPKSAQYRIVLCEGRNRVVRRLFEEFSVCVTKLVRVRYGPITLPRRLASGHWIELSEETVSTIMSNSNV